MMTPTQKRFAEGPLLLLLIMMIQALELSFVPHLPNLIRPLHVTPIIITYLALTRDWGMTFGLSALFAYTGAATVGYSTSVYVASQIWVALGIRLLVSVLALEGRRSFVLLAMGGNVIQKLIVLAILGSQGQSVAVEIFILELLKTTIAVGALAWLFFPLFVKWDHYFEHERDDVNALGVGYR